MYADKYSAVRLAADADADAIWWLPYAVLKIIESFQFRMLFHNGCENYTQLQKHTRNNNKTLITKHALVKILALQVQD